MPTGLDRLKHIVVLMMENRSFDHMFGFLRQQVPDLDGLNGTESNPDTSGKLQPVQVKAEYQGQLNPDPGHHWEDVNTQIFGNAEGNDDGSPKMHGFIKSYFTKRQDVKHSRNVMNCFQPDDLPVLTTLARQFAVCDRWFSSLPGPTVPNRMFAHFGTSFGRVDNALKFNDNGASIYLRLLNAGRTAKLYYYDEESASIGFTFLIRDQPQLFSNFNQFVSDCAQGTLPDYSFVEPNYTDHANLLASDQHPDHNVLAGERFIASVYNNIRRNQQLWESTLLLILYDEHGGLFDHVEPPQIPADGITDPVSGFTFDRLGIRVPAVFVSPWIPAGTVIHRQYEHASIPASAATFFIADASKRKLTIREQRANLFTAPEANLLTLSAARQDAFSFDLGGGPAFAARAGIAGSAVRHITVPDPGKSAYNPARDVSGLLSDHVMELHELEQQLPPDQRTNIDIRSINTEAQASAYIREVTSRLRAQSTRNATTTDH
jgi:phospholipase C